MEPSKLPPPLVHDSPIRTRKLAWAILEEIALEQPGIGLAKNAELDLKINLTKDGFYQPLFGNGLVDGRSYQAATINHRGKTKMVFIVCLQQVRQKPANLKFDYWTGK